MKQKTLNLVLGAVALGLVAVAVLHKKQQDAKVDAERNGPPITTLATAAIEHIALHHNGAPDILLEKRAQHWRLTAPVATDADAVEVDALLRIATSPTRATLDTATIKRGELGLDPPAATLRLNDTTITVGGLEPLKFTRYLEVDAGGANDHIVLIDDPGDRIFDADYSELVAKNLLPMSADIAAIDLPMLHIKRNASGAWEAEPAATGLGQDELQMFVDHWRQARSIGNGVLPADAAKDDSQAITITLADGGTYHYRIANRDGQLLLDAPALNIRYRFPPTAVETMLQLPKPKAAEKPAEPTTPAPAETKP
jgi:hypothetical protein